MRGSMTLNKFCMIVIILITCTAIVTAQGTDATGPRMTFIESTHDFGEIVTGEVVEHVFVFTNSGDDTLEIANVYSG